MGLPIIVLLLWRMAPPLLGGGLVGTDTLTSMLKDLATFTLACVGGYAAIQGLNTWKQQLTGKTEYELARRLLRAVYETREAIARARNPLRLPAEEMRALKEARLHNVDSNSWETYHIIEKAIRDMRWSAVSKALTKLDMERFEAEAIWGQEIGDKVRQFREIEAILYGSIQRYLDCLEDPTHDDDKRAAVLTQVVDGFFRPLLPDKSDPIGDQVDAVVREIEDYLRPKMCLQ